MEDLPQLVGRARALARDTEDPEREIFSGRPELISAEVVLPDLENSLLAGTRR